jgi:alkylhydroperoxidase family enzyme
VTPSRDTGVSGVGEVRDDHGPRLPVLSQEEALLAAERIGIDAKYLTQPIWLMLLARPKYAKALYSVLTDLLFRSTVPVRLRELLIMRTGWNTAAEFEWSQHWSVAERAGVDMQAVLAVRNWHSSDVFDASERAALAAADDVVENGAITSETWRELGRHYDESELLEITGVIATWHYVSVLVRSLQVPLDDGMTSWPPDGEAPTDKSNSATTTPVDRST